MNKEEKQKNEKKKINKQTDSKETLFKNKVGRPSNEILKKRKIFYTIAIIITAIVVISCFCFINSTLNLNLLKGAANNYGITITQERYISPSDNSGTDNGNLPLNTENYISYVDTLDFSYNDIFIINNPNRYTYYYNWYTFNDANFSETSNYNKTKSDATCKSTNSKENDLGAKGVTPTSSLPYRSGKLKIYASQDECINDLKYYRGESSTRGNSIAEASMKYVYNKPQNVINNENELEIIPYRAVSPSSDGKSYVNSYDTYNDSIYITNYNGKTYYYNWFTYLDADFNKLSSYRKPNSCRQISQYYLSINPLGVTVSSSSPRRSGKLRIYSSQRDCIDDRNNSKRDSGVVYEYKMSYVYSGSTTKANTTTDSRTTSKPVITPETSKPIATTQKPVITPETSEPIATTQKPTSQEVISDLKIKRNSKTAKSYNKNSKYPETKSHSKDWEKYSKNMTQAKLNSIAKYSQKYDVSPDLVMAIIMIQCQGKPLIGQNVMGIGLDNKKKYGHSYLECMFDADASIETGVRMVADNIKVDKTEDNAMCHYAGYGSTVSSKCKSKYLNFLNECRNIINDLYDFSGWKYSQQAVPTTTKATTAYTYSMQQTTASTTQKPVTQAPSSVNIGIEFNTEVKPSSNGISYGKIINHAYKNTYNITNNENKSYYYKWITYNSTNISVNNKSNYVPQCRVVEAKKSIIGGGANLTVTTEYPNRAGQLKIYNDLSSCENDTSDSSNYVASSSIKYSYDGNTTINYKYIDSTSKMATILDDLSVTEGTQKKDYSAAAAYAYGAHILSGKNLKLDMGFANYSSYGAIGYGYYTADSIYSFIVKKIDEGIPVVITVNEPGINTSASERYIAEQHRLLVLGYNQAKKNNTSSWTLDDIFAVDCFYDNSTWLSKSVNLRRGSLRDLGVSSITLGNGLEPVTWESKNINIVSSFIAGSEVVTEPSTPASSDIDYGTDDDQFVYVTDVETKNKEATGKNATYKVIKPFFTGLNSISTKIGSQAPGQCYDAVLAYGSYILTGGTISTVCKSPNDFGAYGGKVTQDQRRKIVYDKINAGIPVSIHVQSSTAEHWVLVIGYNNNKSYTQFTLDDYYIIDPYYNGGASTKSGILYSGPMFKNKGASPAIVNGEKIRSVVVGAYTDYEYHTWSSKSSALTYTGRSCYN